ncbi:MAG: hypothetical protein RMZ43_033140 [Nostoc sp. CmiVER01]|uniref:hypothetical protein n=1 Tax=Nostoc sp. CmiVER01 TaxID=3075384 RepID=UPI002AD58195|nr:hypothetical protein [Nostoc sp. CmiVER01]MDZ8126583.1 hypothetical protein [Nostoc sp. CmiVER01]
MAEIKVVDLQNFVELSDDEAQAINGGSIFSRFLKDTFGIRETNLLKPTETTPDPNGLSGTQTGEPPQLPPGTALA